MSSFMATAKSTSDDVRWHVIDASDQVLGRIATEAARLLQGKHKPTYTPFIDTGDHVIVVGAVQELEASGTGPLVFHRGGFAATRSAS